MKCNWSNTTVAIKFSYFIDSAFVLFHPQLTVIRTPKIKQLLFTNSLYSLTTAQNY